MTLVTHSISDFIKYVVIEKGLSKNTKVAYHADLKKFTEYLQQNKVTHLHELTRFNVQGFLTNIKNEGVSENTHLRIFMTLRSFFSYLEKESLIEDNFMKLLHSPTRYQLLPHCLSQEEITLLLKAPYRNNFNGARDAVILELLYATGIRISELCNLNFYDIGDDSIRVIGKGRKERIIPVYQQALSALDHYLISFYPVKEPKITCPLFVSKKGIRINRSSMWRRIQYYSKKVGLDKKISPHTFRHSFATHLLENGADIRVIQELLGHETITTTEKYLHITQTELQKNFSRYHPRF